MAENAVDGRSHRLAYRQQVLEQELFECNVCTEQHASRDKEHVCHRVISPESNKC